MTEKWAGNDLEESCGVVFEVLILKSIGTEEDHEIFKQLYMASRPRFEPLPLELNLERYPHTNLLTIEERPYTAYTFEPVQLPYFI
jgi:hypothetical protein